MAHATAVLDIVDWLLAVPAAQAPGEILDFSGTRLSITFTPTFGGEPVATASSDDGTLVFVSDETAPYFALDLRVADRTWRIGRPTSVVGDILRQPEPLNPARTEWLGRVVLTIHPGSASSGLTLTSQAPVLIPAQPYDGRVVTAPLALPIQGAPGYPTFDPMTDEGKVLTIRDGLLVWLAAGSVGPDPDPVPGAPVGTLDFSDPANSGLLALMPLGAL